MSLFRFALVGALVLLGACASDPTLTTKNVPVLPAMGWDHRPEAEEWTRSVLSALETHGAVLETVEPSDIAAWCPAYPEAEPADRRAFWAGLLSALAKHESRWTPDASGGGGLWLGLMQIDPRTARGYGCAAQTRDALFDGSANLSCAVRIAAHQVGRDGAVMGAPGRWRGVARDWAPFRYPDKVAEMKAWTTAQAYCQG